MTTIIIVNVVLIIALAIYMYILSQDGSGFGIGGALAMGFMLVYGAPVVITIVNLFFALNIFGFNRYVLLSFVPLIVPLAYHTKEWVKKTKRVKTYHKFQPIIQDIVNQVIERDFQDKERVTVSISVDDRFKNSHENVTCVSIHIPYKKDEVPYKAEELSVRLKQEFSSVNERLRPRLQFNYER